MIIAFSGVFFMVGNIGSNIYVFMFLYFHKTWRNRLSTSLMRMAPEVSHTFHVNHVLKNYAKNVFKTGSLVGTSVNHPSKDDDTNFVYIQHHKSMKHLFISSLIVCISFMLKCQR